jgi:protein-S-isoprenylcysteine O-methyltransferase Ste14
MRLRALVGAGDRIAGLTLPFAVVGIAANVIWPWAFHMGLGRPGLVAGIVLLAVGVPLWLTSAALILVEVPKGKLITRGPFALVLHPLYTSVALLVIPGCGLVLDTWVGPAIGTLLYVSSRIFSPREEKALESLFPSEYPSYRARVISNSRTPPSAISERNNRPSLITYDRMNGSCLTTWSCSSRAGTWRG